MLIKITDQNYQNLIAQTDKVPLLIDFWTSRQEACRYNAPVADEIAQDFEDTLEVGKVNVDDCPYMVGTYQISMVPSMALFQKGKLIARILGVVTKEQVVAVLKEKKVV